jgi:hypothetical protein
MADKDGLFAKRKKIATLGKIASVTQSGLDRLLRAVRDEGVPQHFSRGAQYKARKAIAGEMTPYGKLVEPFTFGKLDMAIQNPCAFLYKCAAESAAFADAIRSLLELPDEHVSIVIYADGISPSDGLTKHDQRKAYAIYWSFFEWGPIRLSVEECWMVVAVIRVKELNHVEGALSALVSEIINRFFFNPNGNDLDNTGVFFRLHGDDAVYPKPLKARIKILLADEPALKDLTHCKGHAGFRCCLLCRNVVLAKFYRPDLHINEIPHTCVDCAKLVLHTDASIRATMQRLAEQKPLLTKGLFEELELVHGYGYQPGGLTCSPHVAVASSIMFDWMHCYLEGGLLDVELGECMAALKGTGSEISYDKLKDYLELWVWPRCVPSPNMEKYSATNLPLPT